MHNKTFLIRLLLFFLPAVAAPLSAQEPDLLEPDQAFRISGRADGAQAIIVEWKIADGYYLYRTKFKFRSETQGIELGAPEFPEGKIKKDEFFGDMEVYRGTVSVRVPLERDPSAEDLLTLKTISQGCADIGICYPPHSQTILLALAEPPPAEPSAQADAGERRLEALDTLADLGSTLGFDSEEDELLPADEAFRFSADVEDATRLRLLWQVAPDFYMYRDKIKLSIQDNQSAIIKDVELPAGKTKYDEFFGDTEVYYGEVEALVTLTRTATQATEVVLKAGYQGCAERGICYPPINKEILLNLPAMSAGGGRATAPPTPIPPATATAVDIALDEAAPQSQESPPQSEQDQIAATMLTGNIWLIIVTFFGFGLLLAFTPCIFPMIPILSGIIAGHGKDITPTKAFTLSLVYVLAMAITYTVAGVLAGLFGGNLQAAFQNPWILSVFAGVFVLLALSMFGFYELQLPSSLQSRLSEISNRQQGGHLTGVAIMGFLSALIVGPCVAPPLAGALIYIGQTGDAMLGGLALFALSMGMGLPLIIIGTSAGKLLPKAGPWMDAVKGVFGVGLLAVAIVLLERILPAAIAMLLWSTLLIVSAVYMGALKSLPPEGSGWPKLWKGLGIVLLIYGALMLIGVASGGKDTLQPLRGLNRVAGNAGEPAHLNFNRIKTVADLQQQVALASKQNKAVMLDFYADWCVTCKELEKYTFTDPQVIRALQSVVLLQADVTNNDEQDKKLMQGHFGIPGPPTIIFYGPDGEERRNYRIVGFMPAEKFVSHVTKAIK